MRQQPAEQRGPLARPVRQDARDQALHARNCFDVVKQIAAGPGSQTSLQFRNFALKLTSPVDELAELARDIVAPALEQRCRLTQRLLAVIRI